MLYKYTLQELADLDREFLTPQHVAPVLGCDPQTLRLQARHCPGKLGFQVIIMGNRVKIPKDPFLRFMGMAI